MIYRLVKLNGIELQNSNKLHFDITNQFKRCLNLDTGSELIIIFVYRLFDPHCFSSSVHDEVILSLRSIKYKSNKRKITKS